METLQLKHLASYGKDLKFKAFDYDKNNEKVEIITTISALHYEENCISFIELFPDYYLGEVENEIIVKPILFPLSTLTKEDIKNFYEFNNKDFKSIDWKEWAEDLMFFIKTKEPFQLSQFEYLFSKKFDVFGLIDKNLAEPVTEDFNPYK